MLIKFGSFIFCHLLKYVLNFPLQVWKTTLCKIDRSHKSAIVALRTKISKREQTKVLLIKSCGELLL